MLWYCGVDPGKTGAVAFVGEEPEMCQCFMMPMIASGTKKVLDEHGLRNMFDGFRPVFTVVEKGQVMRKGGVAQGAVSAFSFGEINGLIRGLLIGLDLPLQIVTPQAWKAVVLAGTKKDKGAAIQYCQRAFPNVSLKVSARGTKDQDGKADAICIAEHCRRLRQNTGKG